MSWSSRVRVSPRRLLIVAAAALVPVLAGCEAGSNAPTQHWHYPTVGAGARAQDVEIQNVFAFTSPQATTVPPGQTAGLFFALINDGSPDRLLSIQAPGTATAVTIPGGNIPLQQSQVVLLTGPRPQAIMTGLTRPLVAGTFISVLLNFQKAGTVHMRIPVLGGSQYSSYSPAPSPAPTQTASAKHGHHAATARSTPSPSVSTTR